MIDRARVRVSGTYVPVDYTADETRARCSVYSVNRFRRTPSSGYGLRRVFEYLTFRRRSPSTSQTPVLGEVGTYATVFAINTADTEIETTDLITNRFVMIPNRNDCRTVFRSLSARSFSFYQYRGPS